jgi:hypothetical protein
VRLTAIEAHLIGTEARDLIEVMFHNKDRPAEPADVPAVTEAQSA